MLTAHPNIHSCRLLVVGTVCFLLTSCAIDGGDPSSTQLRITPKNRIWIAFLECHTKALASGTEHLGIDNSVAISGGNGRKITLTNGPEDVRMGSLGSSDNPPHAYTKQLIPSDNYESLITASGDSQLIALHQKLKSIEAAIMASNEMMRLMAASTQLATVERAYTANYQQPGGDTPLEVLEHGGTVGDLNASHDRMENAATDQGIRQARLTLAKQQNKVAQKANSEYEKNESALKAFRQKHAVPADEILSVMRNYIPPGTKAWGTACSLDNFFGGNAMIFEYGTWNY